MNTTERGATEDGGPMGSGVVCSGVDELVVRTAVEELEINDESHTHTRMRLGPGVCAGIEEDTAAILVEDGVVLLEYGSEADVVDDDEALAAAVVVEVLDPTEGEEVTHQASAA